MYISFDLLTIEGVFPQYQRPRGESCHEDYLALKKQLKERNMEERGNLMDCQGDLEGTFKLLVACIEKMALDIIKDLVESIDKGLQHLNRNL